MLNKVIEDQIRLRKVGVCINFSKSKKGSFFYANENLLFADAVAEAFFCLLKDMMDLTIN